MDFKVSQKESRLQPNGSMVDVIVPDVFDLYLTMNGDYIENAEILEDPEELAQSAYFASVRQRGSDTLSPLTGNRWAEAIVGDVSIDVLITDIKESVRDVSVNCNASFEVKLNEDGVPYLAYTIQVVP